MKWGEVRPGTNGVRPPADPVCEIFQFLGRGSRRWSVRVNAPRRTRPYRRRSAGHAAHPDDRGVAVRGVMARRVGLVVTDVAIHLGARRSADPCRQPSDNERLGTSTFRVSVDDPPEPAEGAADSPAREISSSLSQVLPCARGIDAAVSETSRSIISEHRGRLIPIHRVTMITPCAATARIDIGISRSPGPSRGWDNRSTASCTAASRWTRTLCTGRSAGRTRPSALSDRARRRCSRRLRPPRGPREPA